MNLSAELAELQGTGYTVLKGFASQNICRKIQYDSLPTRYDVAINSNEHLPTHLGRGLFNTSVLACSKDAFDICTNSELRSLYSQFLSEPSLLKCVRAYSIARNQQLFKWHADNKSSVDASPDASKGIVAVLFLEDDHEDSFWLTPALYNAPLSETADATPEQIACWNLPCNHVRIRASAGDLLLFSQDLYHQHIIRQMSKLDALWWQVVGESAGSLESIVVRSSFLSSDLSLVRFLGAGCATIGHQNPRTGIRELPIQLLVKNQIVLLAAFCKKLLSRLSTFRA